MNRRKLSFEVLLFVCIFLASSPAQSQLKTDHQVTIVVPSVMEMELTTPPDFAQLLDNLTNSRQKLSTNSNYNLLHNNEPLKMVVEGRGKTPAKGVNVKATTSEPQGSSAISQGTIMILDSIKGFFPAQDALTNITRGIYENGQVDWQMWADKILEQQPQTITVTFTIVNN